MRVYMTGHAGDRECNDRTRKNMESRAAAGHFRKPISDAFYLRRTSAFFVRCIFFSLTDFALCTWERDGFRENKRNIMQTRSCSIAWCVSAQTGNGVTGKGEPDVNGSDDTREYA